MERDKPIRRATGIRRVLLVLGHQRRSDFIARAPGSNDRASDNGDNSDHVTQRMTSVTGFKSTGSDNPPPLDRKRKNKMTAAYSYQDRGRDRSYIRHGRVVLTLDTPTTLPMDGRRNLLRFRNTHHPEMACSTITGASGKSSLGQKD